MEKIEEIVKSLTPAERKIYNSIIASFPATNPKTAYDHAINGGIKFQFISK